MFFFVLKQEKVVKVCFFFVYLINKRIVKAVIITGNKLFSLLMKPITVFIFLTLYSIDTHFDA